MRKTIFYGSALFAALFFIDRYTTLHPSYSFGLIPRYYITNTLRPSLIILMLLFCLEVGNRYITSKIYQTIKAIFGIIIIIYILMFYQINMLSSMADDDLEKSYYSNSLNKRNAKIICNIYGGSFTTFEYIFETANNLCTDARYKSMIEQLDKCPKDNSLCDKFYINQRLSCNAYLFLGTCSTGG